MHTTDTSEAYDRASLLAAISGGWQPKYVLFWATLRERRAWASTC